jgi:uncharacterized damage-inducible protein DinB
MPISQSLIPEFDQEMAGTRRTLERVPEGKTDWKPHPKSMSMGRLAGHLAELPSWIVETMNRSELEMTGDYTPFISSSPAALLAMFDQKVAEGRALIVAASDEDLMKPWSLVVRGQKAFTMPKIAVLRGFVMNHIIHHRGQLTVYLRLNDVAVPSLYGPSADENPGGF